MALATLGLCPLYHLSYSWKLWVWKDVSHRQVHSFRDRPALPHVHFTCALPVFVCWVFSWFFVWDMVSFCIPRWPRTCDPPASASSVLQQSAAKPALHAVFSALPPLSSSYLYRSARRYGDCLPHCRGEMRHRAWERQVPSSSAAKPVRDCHCTDEFQHRAVCCSHLCCRFVFLNKTWKSSLPFMVAWLRFSLVIGLWLQLSHALSF